VRDTDDLGRAKRQWHSTNENGEFRFEDLPNGEHLVWPFVRDGWLRTVPVDLKSGETTRIDLDLGGTAEIRGKVITPDNEERCCMAVWRRGPRPMACSKSGARGWRASS